MLVNLRPKLVLQKATAVTHHGTSLERLRWEWVYIRQAFWELQHRQLHLPYPRELYNLRKNCKRQPRSDYSPRRETSRVPRGHVGVLTVLPPQEKKSLPPLALRRFLAITTCTVTFFKPMTNFRN